MKKFLMIALSLLFVLSLVSCNAFGNRETLRGTVTEVYESSILIETEIGPCVVSLPEGVYDFSVGDTVDVIHSGEIATSYPMQIHHVFAIKRVDPAKN